MFVKLMAAKAECVVVDTTWFYHRFVYEDSTGPSMLLMGRILVAAAAADYNDAGEYCLVTMGDSKMMVPLKTSDHLNMAVVVGHIDAAVDSDNHTSLEENCRMVAVMVTVVVVAGTAVDRFAYCYLAAVVAVDNT